MKKYSKFLGLLIFGLYNYQIGFSQAGKSFPTSAQGLYYHPLSKSLLLIEDIGTNPTNPTTNIWNWNGNIWAKITSAGPGSMDFFKGALNTKTGNLFFYGGKDWQEKPKDENWIFNGKNWHSPNINKIGTHDHHNVVYMDHLDAFLIYGANINGYPNFDSTTWVLKDNKFRGLKIPSPGPRWHYGLVYDKHRKKVMLYGGGFKPEEQWEFDGEKWTKIITDINPGRRLYHQMVYNEATKTIILHGGWHNQDFRDSTNHTPRTTWEWNGNAWKKIAEEPIFAQAMAYYPDRKSIITFGTTGKPGESIIAIWELKNGTWNMLADYGKW